VFELFDLDSSGGITVEEFEVMMQRLNAGLQREDIKGLLQWIVRFILLTPLPQTDGLVRTHLRTL